MECDQFSIKRIQNYSLRITDAHRAWTIASVASDLHTNESWPFVFRQNFLPSQKHARTTFLPSIKPSLPSILLFFSHHSRPPQTNTLQCPQKINCNQMDQPTSPPPPNNSKGSDSEEGSRVSLDGTIRVPEAAVKEWKNVEPAAMDALDKAGASWICLSISGYRLVDGSKTGSCVFVVLAGGDQKKREEATKAVQEVINAAGLGETFDVYAGSSSKGFWQQ